MHEFKLGHKASQTAANINGELGEGSTCYSMVQHWFQKFFRGDMNPKNQEGRKKYVQLSKMKPALVNRRSSILLHNNARVYVAWMTMLGHMLPG